MSEATMTQATYRKTSKGEWVVFGPTSVVRVGQVAVTKRNGETTMVTVVRVGKAFTANGVQCCYGYIAAEPARTYSPQPRGYGRSRRSCITGGNCSSFGTGRSCGAEDCDGF